MRLEPDVNPARGFQKTGSSERCESIDRVPGDEVIRKQASGQNRGWLLSVIRCYHIIHLGVELPTNHCLVVAVCKRVDREHGQSDVPIDQKTT